MLARATIQPTQTTGARSASTLTVPIEDERASPGHAKFGLSFSPESGGQDGRGWPEPARESGRWRVPATDQLGQGSTSRLTPARWVLEAAGTDRESRKCQLRRQKSGRGISASLGRQILRLFDGPVYNGYFRCRRSRSSSQRIRSIRLHPAKRVRAQIRTFPRAERDLQIHEPN
jgi:hypothetical protein